MDKHSNRVYKDEVIIDNSLPRGWVHTMVSCVPAVTVHLTPTVAHARQAASLRCQPASTG